MWSINERLGFLCDTAGSKKPGYERPGGDMELLGTDYLDDMLWILHQEAKELDPKGYESTVAGMAL